MTTNHGVDDRDCDNDSGIDINDEVNINDGR
jgi:hypothetical protein